MMIPTGNKSAELLGIFSVGAAVSLVTSVFVAGSLTGMLPIAGPVANVVLTSALLCAALLLLSRSVLGAERLTLAELGLIPNGTRLRQLAVGFGITSVLFLAVAVVQSAIIDAPWDFQGLPGIRAAIVGLGVTALLVLVEELLFRGVALRYLRGLYGDRGAIVLSALLFGGYHLLQSADWAMGAVFRFAMPVLGGLVFGWAAVRSKGLALPLGLHLGGNWIQSSVAGFSLAESGTASALWRIPISADDVRLLTAPDLPQHLPYMAAIALAFALTWWTLRASGQRHPV